MGRESRVKSLAPRVEGGSQRPSVYRLSTLNRRLSIRWRMTLWNTAAFAVVLVCFGLLVYESLRQIHYDQVDRTLKTRFQELANDERLADAPEQRLQSWVRKFGKSVEIWGIVFDKEGRVVARAEQLMSAFPSASADDLSSSTRETKFDTATIAGVGRMRRLTGRLNVGDDLYTVMLLAELEHVDEEMTQVLWVLLLTIPVTLAAAAALAYWLARKSLAPVDQLRQLTDEITAERLDRRIPILNREDELGALAQTINSMISRLERSFSEVRRFTADASHELRTPISVIQSEAEMGLDSTATLADAQNRLGSILEECARLTWMTDQLLALCREDAGVTPRMGIPVQLATLVTDAVETMQPSANAKSQRLSATCNGEPVVIGDAERLRRVLYNLLDNAIKYTPPEGNVQVTLEQRGAEAVITGRDNGVGIPAEHLPHVFERFYRAHKESSHRGTGAGLGLSIVKSIVTAHNGRVKVESHAGSGTIFRIYFPVARNGNAARG